MNVAAEQRRRAGRANQLTQGVTVGKNVAVFVDVANIFYAAKAAGVDIDYVTLLKAATAGRDLVRAYAYTGLDPDNENQRNFHDFLRRSNYKVVSKDIRKYGDGKVKANLDIELVVDMMKTARNLDIAIVVSGDGDFAPAIRAVQEQGVRVEVISFRGNTSSDLIEVADLFTDIVQLARVEKGTRSGRRVADDDADLSMTEVPDKQTEGTGRRPRPWSRPRPWPRGRAGRRDEHPTAADGSRRCRRPAATAAAASAAGLTVAARRAAVARGRPLTEAISRGRGVHPRRGRRRDPVPTRPPTAGARSRTARTPRRRRRRGGRGRGRGRGRERGRRLSCRGRRERRVCRRPPATAGAADLERGRGRRGGRGRAPRRGPRTTPFGSVWDSQLGTPGSRADAALPPLTSTRRTSTSPRSPST